MATSAKHIVVHGRVQGVGFRHFVQDIGSRLGLEGNVCNCPDSTVEIIVEGDPAAIETFLEKVKKGPSLALVRRIDSGDIPVRGIYGSFKIEGW